MGKNILIAALALVAVLAIGFGVRPAFADSPQGTGDATWEQMHQACIDGDYEAMQEWHAQCWGEDGEAGTAARGMRHGDMMGGGMMGGGMMGGGMMGGW